MPPAEVAWALAAALGVTYLPGLLMLVGGRLPLPIALAVAPAASAFVADVGGRLAEAVGGHWGVGWLLGPALVLGLLVWFLARRWPAATADPVQPGVPRWPHWGRALVVTAVVAGAAFGLSAYLVASEGLAVVPQDFDPTFHANAIRWIAEDGVATSDGLAPMNSFGDERGGYYPVAYHALAAVVFQLTGGDVLAALHATAALWVVGMPLGVAALCRALRLGPVAAAVAALVSTSFTSMPWELYWRGLFPYGFTLACLPALLALLAFGAYRRRVSDAVLLAAACAGLVAVHTSVVASLLVVGAPFVVGLFVWTRDRAALLRWLLVGLGLLVAALLPVAVALGGAIGDTSTGLGTVDWPAVKDVPGAIVAAVGFGTGYRTSNQFRMALLVWLGVALTLVPGRRRALALVPGMVAAMALFVLAAAIDSPLSQLLTTVWWNDQLRLGALAAVLAPVFAGVAVDAVVWLALPAVRRAERGAASGVVPVRAASGADVARPSRGASLLPALAGVGAGVVLAGAGWLVFGSYHGRAVAAVTYTYNRGDGVSPAEQVSFARVRESVPACVGTEPACRVMNDPADGSPWLYALDGVRPVFLHAYRAEPETQRGRLMTHFDEIATDAEVRRIAREHGVDYAFVTEGFIIGQGPRVGGLDQLSHAPGAFELLWRTETSALYRVRWEALPPG